MMKSVFEPNEKERPGHNVTEALKIE